jgi:ABC-type Fe3+ transport system substrate-binding protein
MARIFIHTPLNISRTLVKMLEEFCRQLQERQGLEIAIETQPHRPDEDSRFSSYLEKNELPDLTIGHVNDFADLTKEYLEEHLRTLPGRFPVRKELAELGFTDSRAYFHPFVVIPFAMFYNPELLDEKDVPKRWSDILDPQWDNRIIMPDEYRMASVIVRTFMAADFPDKFENFKNNVTYAGSPLEVVNAVDEGKYTIGLTNIAFAHISSQKNTRIIWPQDGLFCMPQVMAWSNKAPEAMLEIGDFLLSKQVQEYLLLQSFVPVSPEVPLPQLMQENHCSLRWKGWEYFLKVIRGRKAQ